MFSFYLLLLSKTASHLLISFFFFLVFFSCHYLAFIHRHHHQQPNINCAWPFIHLFRLSSFILMCTLLLSTPTRTNSFIRLSLTFALYLPPLRRIAHLSVSFCPFSFALFILGSPKLNRQTIQSAKAAFLDLIIFRSFVLSFFFRILVRFCSNVLLTLMHRSPIRYLFPIRTFLVGTCCLPYLGTPFSTFTRYTHTHICASVGSFIHTKKTRILVHKRP